MVHSIYRVGSDGSQKLIANIFDADTAEELLATLRADLRPYNTFGYNMVSKVVMYNNDIPLPE
jgi:hypothetical protein